jgi:hypothetical protein
MKHLAAGFALAALGVTAVFAQGARSDDPDRMAKGGGALPAGWMARLDNGSTKIDGVQVMAMGAGLHFVTGPAGIYYRPADTRRGSYEIHATFTQLAPAAHPEAYGLFIGGADLAGVQQKYTYLEVRQDGQFLIKRRAGSGTPTVTDWTANAAIKKSDAATKGVNRLAIIVSADKVRFLDNGDELASMPAATVDVAGIAGLRVNHNLSVQVDGFEVK